MEGLYYGKLRPIIMSFVISICIFFMAIPYGNEARKIDFSYEITSQDAVFETNDSVAVRVTATNCGRPFEIDSEDEITVNFYQIVDGKQITLGLYCFYPDVYAYPYPKLFKEGDTVTTSFCGLMYVFDEDDAYIPGTYDMKVSFGGCSQVFEDVITVK